MSSISLSAFESNDCQDGKVCKVFAQIRLSLIVVRGLRAPRSLNLPIVAGHGDHALQCKMRCLPKTLHTRSISIHLTKNAPLL